MKRCVLYTGPALLLAMSACTGTVAEDPITGRGAETGVDAGGGGAGGGGGGGGAGDDASSTPQAQPTILASSLAQPTTLRVDATSVYVAENLIPPAAYNVYIDTIPIGGGTATRITGDFNDNSFGIDANFVYFAPQNVGVDQIPLAGGKATLFGGAPTASRVFADSAGVYWWQTVYDSRGAIAGAGLFFQSTLAGGSGALQLTVDGSAPTSIATDSANVYWIDTANSVTTTLGSIHSISRLGGADVTVVNGLNDPIAMAVDDTNVYWLETGNLGGSPKVAGTLSYAPKSGGTPTVLATGLAQPFSLAIDETSAYWTNSGVDANTGGSIQKVSKSGGPVTTLASRPGWPTAIAVDANYVYWDELGTGDTTGSVLRIAK